MWLKELFKWVKMRAGENGRHLLFVASIAGGLVSLARGATQYTVTPITGLDSPISINSVGQVVGSRRIWTPSTPNGLTGTSILLPPPPGLSLASGIDINDYGQVLGSVDIMGSDSRMYERVVLWTPSTPNGTSFSTVVLEPLPNYTEIRPSGINNFGQVVGQLRNHLTDQNAPFLWTPGAANQQSGSMTILHDPRSDVVRGAANDINEHGQVTGRAYLLAEGNVNERTFLWTPDAANATTGTMTDLPHDFFEQQEINNSGQIVGRRTYGGMIASTWIPTVPSNAPLSLINLSLEFSRGLAINSQGDVLGLGRLSESGPSVPFIWNATDGSIDLNTLLDDSGAGWHLVRAESINDLGQIVGESNNGGFLLTPIPEPSTTGMLLACVVLPLFRRRR